MSLSDGAYSSVVAGSKSTLVPGRLIQLLLLAVGMAAGGYVRTEISPLQEALAAALSITDNQMAVLQGPLIGIPVTLAAIPLGLVIDRYSRVRLLFALVALSCIGSLITAFAPNFTALLLTRGLTGLVGLCTIPVSYSLLADLFPPDQRGRATTVICIGQLAGISAAFAWGGKLLAVSESGPYGWKAATLWMTLPLAMAVLFMLGLREPQRRGAPDAPVRASHARAAFRRLRSIVGPLVVGVVLVETAVGAILIWATPMLSRNFALPPDRVGAIMALTTAVGGTVGPILGGPLADFCQRTGGPRRTFMVLSALAVMSAPTDLFAFVSGDTTTSVLLIVAMTSLQTLAVTGMTLFTVVTPGECRGLFMSVWVGINLFFVFAIAPVTVSILSTVMGGPGLIGQALSTVCVASSLLAATSFVLGAKNMSRMDLQVR